VLHLILPRVQLALIHQNAFENAAEGLSTAQAGAEAKTYSMHSLGA
jgi:hypothetical protein